MYKPESFLENETHKILWDFETETDNPIWRRRPDNVLIIWKKSHLVDFAVLVNHRVENKRKQKSDKYLDIAREFKRLWNMKVTIVKLNNTDISKDISYLIFYGSPKGRLPWKNQVTSLTVAQVRINFLGVRHCALSSVSLSFDPFV